ncbi:IS4 family transposase [Pseudomonas sp. PDM25]|jgi:IS4 transposase|uniref:IS4 family transposase n=1 Tax=Pseudomonas sp. PDM25 TaxID=2854772 RepID=UPI001C476B45|nr:IS4 family transposase [Pseudomonas sp. PDM25]MBV7515921.1 IS4 family transposase [Pseudomonas sp. PDM25]
MTKLILEQAVPAAWVDQVFEEQRQRQYPRELLFSTIVELMSLVSLGLRPSLHAAARQMEHLPVTLAALYDKVSRTEPALLRALVTGSAERLAPTIEELGYSAVLPGWQLRVVDGNHLPSTEKRLGALRRERGAARPGFSVVVYDPDLDQIVDLQPCEDAYASERVGVLPLLARASEGQLWMADRLYCTLPVMQACEEASASFIIRQPSKHPRLIQESDWQEPVPVEAGTVREQTIELNGGHRWRRVELNLQTTTESGDSVMWFWSNLPDTISAEQIADLYRRRWSIEGMFQRLESVLDSEIESLGSPRAALLGFASAVLAYNVLAVLKRSVEQAHRETQPEAWEASIFHLAVQVRSGYEGMQIALPPDYLLLQSTSATLAQRLLALARNIKPKQVAKSIRGPKIAKSKEWLEGRAANAHVSTARVLKAHKKKTP